MATNGNLNVAELVEVQPGKHAQHNCADAFFRLDAYSRAKYGIGLRISDGGDYRSYLEQSTLRTAWIAGGRQGYPPAIPGFSNHGWGTALDIWNWTHLTDADIAQFGFVRDVPGEGWHLHYIGPITPRPVTPPIEPEEDEEEVTLYIKDTETGAVYGLDPNADAPRLTILGKQGSTSLGDITTAIVPKVGAFTGPQTANLVAIHGVQPVSAPAFDILKNNKPPIKGLSKESA